MKLTIDVARAIRFIRVTPVFDSSLIGSSTSEPMIGISSRADNMNENNNNWTLLDLC